MSFLILFCLYTNEYQSNHASRFVLKYAEDSVIVSLLHGSEYDHGPVLDEFVNWYSCSLCDHGKAGVSSTSVWALS